MANIYARQIHDGKITINDVPDRWVEQTKAAYFEKYGEVI